MIIRGTTIKQKESNRSNTQSTMSGFLRLGLNTGLRRISYGRVLGVSIITASSLLTVSNFSRINLINNDMKQRNQFDSLPALDDRRSRSLVYKELCAGSILGVVSGIVIGKLSTLIVYLTVIGALTVEWLANRKVIDRNYLVAGLSDTVKRVMNTNINLDKFYFKVSYLTTFVLAALNI